MRPSVLESVKLAIDAEMLAQGVKKAELARRLGWHMPQVDRLLDLDHASRIEHPESAARSLGLKIGLSVVQLLALAPALPTRGRRSNARGLGQGSPSQ